MITNPILEFTKLLSRSSEMLSIDIGFKNIKVVLAHRRLNDTIKISKLIIEPITFEIGEDVNAKIEKILKRILEDNEIVHRDAKLVVSQGISIMSKAIYIDGQDISAIEQKVFRELEKKSIKEIGSQKLIYNIVGKIGRYLKVMITILPDNLNGMYLDLMEKVSINPVALDLPFYSIARFFSDFSNYSEIADYRDDAVAVIDLGGKTTTLCIFNNGVLDFCRVLLLGGENLDGVIAARLGINTAVAEEFKKTYGLVDQFLNPMIIPDYSNNVCIFQEDEIVKTVSKCSRIFAKELMVNLEKSIDVYVNKCGGVPISKILLIGGGSALKGLKSFVEEVMDKPVYTVEHFEFAGMEFDEKVEKGEMRYFISAIGSII